MDFEFVEALNQQDKMKNWRSAYWKFFNASGRIIGLIFFVGGLVGSICSFRSRQNLQVSQFESWIMIVGFAVAALLGILILAARPYQPKDDNSKNSSK